MKKISEEEAKELIEQNKQEVKQILEEGGKIIKTIISEKDKDTIITKIEPVEGKPTSSKIIITKNRILGKCFNENP